jgi:cold-inducible RNA-binding protein
MGNKLYIGNLATGTTEATLTETFAKCGTVTSARIISDRGTGVSKGFGFVEMSSDAEAAKGIAEVHGRELDGQSLVVNEARPKNPRPALNTDDHPGGLNGNRGRY